MSDQQQPWSGSNPSYPADGFGGVSQPSSFPQFDDTYGSAGQSSSGAYTYGDYTYGDPYYGQEAQNPLNAPVTAGPYAANYAQPTEPATETWAQPYAETSYSSGYAPGSYSSNQEMVPYDPYAAGGQYATGYPVTPYQAPKSKVAAALLAWFLGGLGMHNFYLGRKDRAITQLCLFLGGIFTVFFLIGIIPLVIVQVWALVDFIQILTGSGGYDRDGNGQPLTT